MCRAVFRNINLVFSSQQSTGVDSFEDEILEIIPLRTIPHLSRSKLNHSQIIHLQGCRWYRISINRCTCAVLHGYLEYLHSRIHSADSHLSNRNSDVLLYIAKNKQGELT